MNGIRLDDGELQNADGVVNLMIIGLLSLGKRSVDLLVEIQYIQSFSSEDLFHVVDQAQSLAHLETAIHRLIEGQIAETEN